MFRSKSAGSIDHTVLCGGNLSAIKIEEDDNVAYVKIHTFYSLLLYNYHFINKSNIIYQCYKLYLTIALVRVMQYQPVVLQKFKNKEESRMIPR